MSKLAEFRAAEQQLRQQLSLLEKLKSDSALQRELEFSDQLQQLMTEYGMRLTDVVNILDPESTITAAVQDRRKTRTLRVYRNPHTGEVVETKGGNHSVLREWKEKHGKVLVESWRTQ